MKNGVEKYFVFIHLENYSFWTAPPMKTSKETNTVLADRYPEHLGHCVCWQPPWLFGKFWSVISAFIDPVTKSKIHFLRGEYQKGTENDLIMTALVGENWRELCGVDQKQYQPAAALGYDHDTFWKQVVVDEKEWQAAFAAQLEAEEKEAKAGIPKKPKQSKETKAASPVSGSPSSPASPGDPMSVASAPASPAVASPSPVSTPAASPHPAEAARAV